jgi:hypothetical protein
MHHDDENKGRRKDCQMLMNVEKESGKRLFGLSLIKCKSNWSGKTMYIKEVRSNVPVGVRTNGEEAAGNCSVTGSQRSPNWSTGLQWMGLVAIAGSKNAVRYAY